jgi:hypothetical protein
MEKPALEQ